MKEAVNWFESWFDSDYYRLLYRERDEQEAGYFLSHLLTFLNPPPGARMLDAACGTGRHSVYLSKKGFDVTGIDLSEKLIGKNKPFENEKLAFFVHDIRHVLRVNYFQYIFNLFTSFGYFETEREDISVLQSFRSALKPGGILILDYMNSHRAVSQLVLHEEKEADGVHFDIRRAVEGRAIVKRITVRDGRETHHFIEKVKTLNPADFERYMKAARMKILHLSGSYDLTPFDELQSERLIIIAEK